MSEACTNSSTHSSASPTKSVVCDLCWVVSPEPKPHSSRTFGKEARLRLQLSQSSSPVACSHLRLQIGVSNPQLSSPLTRNLTAQFLRSRGAVCEARVVSSQAWFTGRRTLSSPKQQARLRYSRSELPTPVLAQPTRRARLVSLQVRLSLQSTARDVKRERLASRSPGRL